ncbi:MAG: bifunctional oligoribonuclease/PAP phosphatase NrnA [Halococcoides sp.]
MGSRLVVGTASIAKTLCTRAEQSSGDTTLVTDDEALAQWGYEQEGCPVHRADPTVTSTYAELGPIDSAAVTDRCEVIAAAIETAFPDAYVVTLESASTADATIDRTSVLSDAVVEATAPRRRHLSNLRPILDEAADLAIITHDNPDPDAIASGMALASVADRFACEPTICHFGSVSHQQNRAFVNLLEVELTRLESPDPVAAFDAIALVDHARPGINDQLDRSTPIDVVIDHHPPRAPVDARYVDLNSSVGATSSLMVEYLDHFGVDLERTLATALLFGQRVDTDQFSREVSARDLDVAASLVEAADLTVLQRIENPGVSPSALDTIGRAITNRRRQGSIVTSFVGEPDDRDTLAQAADQLLAIEDVTTTLVYGLVEDMIHLSARARGARIDVGETVREAFDRIGSAGGHTDMAGGQLQVGLLVDRDEADDIETIVERVIADRFLEAIDRRPKRELDVRDRDAIPSDSLIDPHEGWGDDR